MTKHDSQIINIQTIAQEGIPMPNSKAFFNSAARIWDKKNRRDENMVKTVLRLSDLSPGLSILDAGCGTGFLEPLLLLTKPKKITAMDFAVNMVTVARTKLQDPAVEFLCMNIFDMNPWNYQFDFCIFYNSFPHFEDHARLAAHVSQLLVPGGRLTISHIQGKKAANGGAVSPGLPAQGMINLLRPYFRLDVLIDNNSLFMVSGVRLNK